MNVVSVISLIIVIGISIFQMKDANKVINEKWYKALEREDRIKVTSLLKSLWKKNIILIGLMSGVLLIMISTFIGKTLSYEFELSVIALIFCIICIIVLIKSREKYNNEIKKFNS